MNLRRKMSALTEKNTFIITNDGPKREERSLFFMCFGSVGDMLVLRTSVADN